METPLLFNDNKLLNSATGKMHRLIITTPDNYWRAMYETNLGFIKVYMNKGDETERTLARAACYFIIDHADKVVSTIDKQRFALVVKNILLGIGIYTDDDTATD